MKRKHSDISDNIIQYNFTVEGMTCQNCKRKVEEGVHKISGVNAVAADPDTDTLEVYGTNITDEAIKKTIEELGYTYIGIKNS